MNETGPLLPAGVALTAVLMAREREVETARPEAEGGAQLAGVRDLGAPGSDLVADVVLPAAERSAGYAAGRRGLVDNGSPLVGAIADPAAWLAEHGWDGGPVDVAARVADLGRPLPLCLDPRSEDGALFAFVEAAPVP